MRLALFDFDGTLTTKDSLGEFFKFAFGRPYYYLKILLFSPVLILYKLKIMDNSYAKELLFRFFFKNIDELAFRERAQHYAEEEIEKILRRDIYAKFLEHIEHGDRVLIVSASMRCWLLPFAQKHSVELLCTELAFEDGKFSGYFATKNCHGEEKLRRVKEVVELADFEEIYAYGDSSGDKYLWSVADHKIKVK